MNLKRLTLILMISLLACLAISLVSAADIDYSNESANITFQGVQFTIPEGFGQSRDSEDFDDLGSTGRTCYYINEYNGEIVITVISDWMGMSLEELEKEGAKKTTINGHEGWRYTEDGLNYFGYVHDDKGILIGVTNETRLFEVIL